MDFYIKRNGLLSELLVLNPSQSFDLVLKLSPVMSMSPPFPVIENKRLVKR